MLSNTLPNRDFQMVNIRSGHETIDFLSAMSRPEMSHFNAVIVSLTDTDGTPNVATGPGVTKEALSDAFEPDRMDELSIFVNVNDSGNVILNKTSERDDVTFRQFGRLVEFAIANAGIMPGTAFPMFYWYTVRYLCEWKPNPTQGCLCRFSTCTTSLTLLLKTLPTITHMQPDVPLCWIPWQKQLAVLEKAM